MTKHVFQRTNNDCMLACIAMAAGRDYDDLWSQEWLDEVCQSQGADQTFTRKAMEHAGFQPYVNGDHGKIVWEVNVWDANSREPMLQLLLRGRRAIISVPSLNHFAGWHVVFWDGHQLFDPNNPESGKQFYRWIEQLAPRRVWIFDEGGRHGNPV